MAQKKAKEPFRSSAFVMMTLLFRVLVTFVSNDPLEGHATAEGFHRLGCSFTNGSDETLLNGQS